MTDAELTAHFDGNRSSIESEKRKIKTHRSPASASA